MSEYARKIKTGKRSNNLYDPKSKLPFKLSRTRLEDFINCPRCFYLDRRLGIEEPSGPQFNLNIAVDALMKKEFDVYRAKREPHPIMKRYRVDAIPLSHPDLDTWRNPFKGIQFLHPQTNFLVFGGVDDVWQRPEGELVIVDYKATSKDGEVTLDDEWKDAYKRQMEIYQWLFRRNNFKVSNTGYFVYCNGLKSEEGFYDQLKFKTVILPYAGNDAWIEPALMGAYECLRSDNLPVSSSKCDLCLYRKVAGEAESSRTSS
ncbi:MAG: PD-(D/E)XK nuclease family protein [Candidatus Omnitrophica bacterium]|nr:PD-(D/E)XK nuclease family protein [Candidatus Omnitrophota bacterium]